MFDVRRALIERLDFTSALVRTSDAYAYPTDCNQRALDALSQVKEQLVGAGPVDTLRLVLLYAPKSLLHEIAMDNDWAPQYLNLTHDVDRLLQELKG
jgi:hypothetical protein